MSACAWLLVCAYFVLVVLCVLLCWEVCLCTICSVLGCVGAELYLSGVCMLALCLLIMHELSRYVCFWLDVR